MPETEGRSVVPGGPSCFGELLRGLSACADSNLNLQPFGSRPPTAGRRCERPNRGSGLDTGPARIHLGQVRSDTEANHDLRLCLHGVRACLGSRAADHRSPVDGMPQLPRAGGQAASVGWAGLHPQRRGLVFRPLFIRQAWERKVRIHFRDCASEVREEIGYGEPVRKWCLWHLCLPGGRCELVTASSLQVPARPQSAAGQNQQELVDRYDRKDVLRVAD